MLYVTFIKKKSVGREGAIQYLIYLITTHFFQIL